MLLKEGFLKLIQFSPFKTSYLKHLKKLGLTYFNKIWFGKSEKRNFLSKTLTLI